jgi:hypothetical protein
MRANYRDFVGGSETAVWNKQDAPYPIDRTPFVLRSVRPVALSKGKPKNIECLFFVPQTNQKVNLATEIVERGLGLRILSGAVINAMPSYQYHFVVLAKEPTRYSYIKTLDSVDVPYHGETEFDATEDALHYRVEQLDVSKTISLSDNPLTWTTTAYILWDEVDPAVFTPAQERALVDWIHWGGQLIISGPDSLDLLKGSFLDRYLPARSSGPRRIVADDLAQLNEDQLVNGEKIGWLISTERVPGQPLLPTVPWSGVKLDIVDGAKALPYTGNLLAERQVGRGRIVVSAMQLSERDLINWKSGFESLFNACLLRRKPRVYREGIYGGPTLLWDATNDPSLSERRLDARLTTKLNFFARDSGVETAYRHEVIEDEQFQQYDQFGQPQSIREYRPPAASGGIGAWNDFSATANEARSALREAAGVEVPDSSFVVVCLVAYLTVLVPLNWLLFHTLGRIEWAWIAAPLIAIAGTWVVVEQARLDIGFVRAQTEIGLLEQQPGHPRAHLSRYTALYTSLSTTYDLEFGNLTTLAAPFPSSAEGNMLRGASHVPIDFQRHDSVRLTGLPVSSASTQLVHSEQMFALDGAIVLGKSSATNREQVENHTQFAWKSVAVISKPTAAELEDRPAVKLKGAWIGELLPGRSVALSYHEHFDGTEQPFAEKRLDEERLQRSPRLNLEPMFRLAMNVEYMEPGEERLVARVDEVLPGETITPSASQVRGATLIVAHLRYAELDRPLADKNTRRDIKAAEQAEMDLLDSE